VAALGKYTDHKIVLITEGRTTSDNTTKNLEIVNVPLESPRLPLFNIMMDNLVCYRSCLWGNYFIREAKKIADELITKHSFDLLITISHPVDSHVAGLSIKQKYPDLRWITYFSDLWPLSLLPKPYKRNKLLTIIEMRFLKQTLEQCDGFLTPSQYALNIIKEKVPTQAQIGTVPHCIKEHKIDSTGKLNGYIIHSGFLHKERINENLILAIKELAEEEKDFKGIIQIGGYHKGLIKLLKKHNCSSFILINKLPEYIAINIQSLVETGIIIEGPMQSPSPFMPSKITDGIQFNKKLVVITPRKSFLRDLATHNKGIFCCSYTKNDIKETIQKAYQSVERINIETISLFHPSTIAMQYEEFFRKVLVSE